MITLNSVEIDIELVETSFINGKRTLYIYLFYTVKDCKINTIIGEWKLFRPAIFNHIKTVRKLYIFRH